MIPQQSMLTCPCCGYKTISEEYDICPICFWEYDPVQQSDPDYPRGANSTSLRQAQQNYLCFGACEESAVKSVRKPAPNDVRDSTWRILG
jgi:hypothetical protein